MFLNVIKSFISFHFIHFMKNILMLSEFCSQDFSVNKTLVITVIPCKYDRNHVLCGTFK